MDVASKDLGWPDTYEAAVASVQIAEYLPDKFALQMCQYL